MATWRPASASPENPTETKEYIAKYYENLYQAREGKPEYQTWTDKITQHVKEVDDQTKTKYKPEKATIKELTKTIKQMKTTKRQAQIKYQMKYLQMQTQK